jgi:hypothetical protein
MAKFVEVPVVDKKGESSIYHMNIDNINYFRRWVGDKGYIQTVVYFKSTEKYVVVNKPVEEFSKVVGDNS